MTLAEHHLLLLALAWILASVPLALLAFQVWFRDRPVHPVIPHEDDSPAGSFLDVPLLPVPGPREPVAGHPRWKRVDGWVALATVAVLSLLMGPLVMPPESGETFQLSANLMLMQLVFQLGMAGLLLFYLAGVRGFNLLSLFGLKRQRMVMVPVWALLWIVPGTLLVGLVNYLTMPWLLGLLGQSEASPQLIVKALGQSPDAMTKLAVVACVGFGAPFMEELVFRGFLYSVAKRFTHWSYAALGSALFFASVHGNVMSFVPLALLGLLFTAAYEQTKNLLVPIVMHAMFNLCQVALMFYAPELARYLEKT
jgi:membrane protease YdiL (CAAX protease family)